MVATGFLAIGPKSLNERDRRQFQADVVDEQMGATFQAFQALTVSYARCHDHRFDPIPQTDYYALAGIFRSTETCYGTIRVVQSNHPSPLLELPREAEVTMPLTALSSTRREFIEKQIQDQRARLADAQTTARSGSDPRRDVAVGREPGCAAASILHIFFQILRALRDLRGGS